MPYRTLIATLLALLLAALSSFAADVTETDPTKHYMGMNPNFQTTWSADRAFVDLANTSRVTKLNDWNTEPPRDQSGYPTTDFRWIFEEGYSQVGVYKLSFTGQATMPSTSNAAMTSVVYDSVNNRTTADVTVSTANTIAFIEFNATKRTAGSATNTGITGIKLIRPGYPTDGSVVYTTDFLNQLRRTHVFRSMNWTLANTNHMVSWDERIRPDIFCQTLPGHYGAVALEHLIRVANDTNNDLWVCMPVHCDADVVTKTIQMVLYGSDGTNPFTSPQISPVYPPLAANLKLYIEFGNEIWNGFGPGFENYGMVKDAADAIRLSSSPHPIKLNDAGDSDQYVMAGRYWAWRATEISKSCRAASPTDFMTRVRPVLMCQQGGGWLDKMIPFINNYYGTGKDGTGSHTVSYYFYGLGGTSYVYGNDDAYVANGNTSAFIQSIDLPTLATALKWEAMYARSEGIKHILYEGGPHPQPANVINDVGWNAINADPSMENKLIEVSDVLDQAGVDLAVYFQTAGGFWAYTPDISDFNSPKYRAIDTLRTSRPRQPITMGTAIPGTVVLRTVDTLTTDTFSITYDSRDVIALRQGNINCLVRTDQAGSYTIGIAANPTVANSSYGIFANGTRISNITLTPGTWTQPTVTVSLPAGLSGIRIQTNSAADWAAFHSLVFTRIDVALAITSMAPAGGVVGTAYTHSYSANGTGPITYSLSAGSLPNGLILSSAGVLSGTPTAAGTFTGTVTASNGTDPNATQAFNIAITAPSSPPTITSTPPVGGSVGVAYSTHTYTASGTTPVTFSVTAGSLPTGLTLSSAGVLSGTPTAAGTFTGTVTAANGMSPNATQAFSIVISVPLGTLVQWTTFTGNSASNANPTETASLVATNLQTSSGALSRGAGFNPTGDQSYGPWSSNFLGTQAFANPANLAGSIAANIYAAFTLTPSAGYAPSVSTVSFYGYCLQGTSTAELLYSTDGFVTYTSLGAKVTGSGSSNLLTYDTSAVAALQNATTPITFRVYFYGEANGYFVRGIGGEPTTATPALKVTGSVALSSLVTTPVMSPVAGTYVGNQSVTIGSSAGASIRYTTDGSTPTSTTGTLYTAPVSVSVSQTIKAIAYKPKTGSSDKSA
ncbi:MAG: putative Ig domain-containing protein [Verrucomicrobiota bacterium]|nr:putative Ig domain-containing protein [Verrucomicrobiota bacterium]